MRQLKQVVIINDFGFIEGGASNVAITTALMLATHLPTHFICAVGPIDESLKRSNLSSYAAYHEFDNLHNPSRLQGALDGLYNKGFSAFLQKKMAAFSPSETIVHIHTWTKGCSSSVFHVLCKLGFQICLTLHDFGYACPNLGFFNFKKKRICHHKAMSLSCMLCNCDSRSIAFKVYRLIRQKIQSHYIKHPNIRLICVSDFSKRLLSPYFFTSHHPQGDVLHNPIDFSNHRRRVQAEENRYYLYLGRLSQEKGIQLFCRAITECDVPGIVVGDGDCLENLKEQYPNISFLGWKNREAIDDILKTTRCLVFPSLLYETLGLTPLEAMAWGVPSITPNQNASSDFMENKKNGLIFETGNLSSLKQQIFAMQDDTLTQSLSEYGYQHFETEKWAMTRHLQNLLSIYHETLNHI